MDFLTMSRKVEGNLYTCLEDFEKDFKLVWHNATIYNQKDTIYYKAAIRVKEAGKCWRMERGQVYAEREQVKYEGKEVGGGGGGGGEHRPVHSNKKQFVALSTRTCFNCFLLCPHWHRC